MACRSDRDALLEVERVARMAVRYDGAGSGVARAGGPLDVVLARLDRSRAGDDEGEVVLHYSHVDYAVEVSDTWRIVRWGRDVVAETRDPDACAAAFRLLTS